MTDRLVRDADLSVLTVPHDEPPHQPPRPRRWASGLGSAVAGGIVLSLLYWLLGLGSARPEVDAVRVHAVGGPASPPALSASGYVVAQRQASVASKGTGRLEYLGVAVGSPVKAGDIVARIQQDDVQALRYQARARLQVAKAALTNARAELRDAEQSYARARALLPNQFISQAEFDQAQNRLHRAQATVRSASAAITAADADVQSADVMLDNTVIRAPFDGIVLKKFAEVGEVVAPMASSANSRGAVVLIADMASLMVETELSEVSIGRIIQGQSADIVLDSAPGVHYPGTVEQIMPTADRSKGTVLVKVRFNTIDERVLPEMSAKVTFHPPAVSSDAGAARLFVPSSSIVRKSGRPVLYVVEDESARELEIDVIAESNGESEVRGPLSASSRVIRVPPPSLTDGARVRVRIAHEEGASR